MCGCNEGREISIYGHRIWGSEVGLLMLSIAINQDASAAPEGVRRASLLFSSQNTTRQVVCEFLRSEACHEYRRRQLMSFATIGCPRYPAQSPNHSLCFPSDLIGEFLWRFLATISNLHQQTTPECSSSNQSYPLTHLYPQPRF